MRAALGTRHLLPVRLPFHSASPLPSLRWRKGQHTTPGFLLVLDAEGMRKTHVRRQLRASCRPPPSPSLPTLNHFLVLPSVLSQAISSPTARPWRLRNFASFARHQEQAHSPFRPAASFRPHNKAFFLEPPPTLPLPIPSCSSFPDQRRDGASMETQLKELLQRIYAAETHAPAASAADCESQPLNPDDFRMYVYKVSKEASARKGEQGRGRPAWRSPRRPPHIGPPPFPQILPCTRRGPHSWVECSYCHPGEKATRRCPQKFSYVPITCPAMKAVSARPASLGKRS
jgi:hypothetical protein